MFLKIKINGVCSRRESVKLLCIKNSSGHTIRFNSFTPHIWSLGLLGVDAALSRRNRKDQEGSNPLGTARKCSLKF